MSSPHKKEKEPSPFFFSSNLYQTFGSDPLPVSSEDNPPGLRSVVHPTRSASRRQSPVRREGGRGVRRDDRDVVPSKRKKKKEYRYLFLLFYSCCCTPLYLSVHSFLVAFSFLGILHIVWVSLSLVYMRKTRSTEGPSTVSGEVYGDWPIP